MTDDWGAPVIRETGFRGLDDCPGARVTGMTGMTGMGGGGDGKPCDPLQIPYISRGRRIPPCSCVWHRSGGVGEGQLAGFGISASSLFENRPPPHPPTPKKRGKFLRSALFAPGGRGYRGGAGRQAAHRPPLQGAGGRE